MTVIRNVLLFRPEGTWERGSLYIENGRIREPFPDSRPDLLLDGEGLRLIPGLIDIHLHGCGGCDACDGTDEALRAIAEYELSLGVTSMALAVMTLPSRELKGILSAIASHAGRQDPYSEADIAGINLEGPFISERKKGAQDGRYILPCSEELLEEFLEAGQGLIRFLGLAPEASATALDFISEVKDRVRLSFAHTDADYETAREAVRRGVTHATHLYNAMSSFTHRNPGVVGAVFDSASVDAELICDGIHVHPAAIRTAFRLLGADRISLISDSMRAAGMSDGIYSLGGQEVSVKGREARLRSDGSLAGSVSSLADCFRYAVLHAGIPLEDALLSSTLTPARSLRIDRSAGSIEPGKYADLILMDPGDLSFRWIMKRGKII